MLGHVRVEQDQRKRLAPARRLGESDRVPRRRCRRAIGFIRHG